MQQQQEQQRRLQSVEVAANVELSASTVSVSEGGTGVVYTIVLSDDPTTTVNVDISTASARISLSTSQLVFTASDWDTAQPVTISAVDDTAVESLVEVAVLHEVDIPGDFVWTGAFSPSSGESLTVRVYDNDDAGILVSASTLYMDEGGSGTYDVKLLGSPSEAVTVRTLIVSADVGPHGWW